MRAVRVLRCAVCVTGGGGTTQRINYETKRLTDEVRQEYPWARTFADDIMMCRWRKGGGKSRKVIPVIEE